MFAPINKIYDRIESFFLKSDVWIFATVMTMISLIFTIEHEPYSLAIFLARLIAFTLVFLPVFWFVHFRTRLKERMKKWLYRGLGAFMFMGYPIIAVALTELFGPEPISDQLAPTKEMMVGTAVIGMSFFATATVLFGLLESRWIPDIRRRISRHLSPTKILGAFSVFAAMIAIAANPDYGQTTEGMNDLLAMGLYISAVAQLWFVYLPYLGLFHIHHKFLYRKVLLQRGLLFYVASGVTAILAFAPIHGIYARMFPLVDAWDLHTSGFKGGAIAPENFLIAGLFLIFSVPVILFLEWVHKTRTITLLEKEKTDTELSLLKQQVNPHFFFNTLNNLYSLSLKQAPETPDTVLQLSELMRYVIYRAKEESVELQEEVKYLKDYLDLQRIRLYQDADIEFTVKMENPELEIPPLLFIILVENAFKHGIEPAVGECFLELKLTETNGNIEFYCRNSVEPEAAAKVRSGGIGLQNLNRRLELLYPDEFEIQVDAQPEEYCVTLNLWGEAPPLFDEELRMKELVPNFEEELL